MRICRIYMNRTDPYKSVEYMDECKDYEPKDIRWYKIFGIVCDDKEQITGPICGFKIDRSCDITKDNTYFDVIITNEQGQKEKGFMYMSKDYKRYLYNPAKNKIPVIGMEDWMIHNILLFIYYHNLDRMVW